ncbi:Asp-tRNA(Asn)/Glu-tRNA(Gln) amidotransferase subunit GatA [Nanoarchaeota archaeon]
MEVKEKLKLLKSGKLRAVDNIKSFLKRIEELDNGKGINAFLHINKKALKEAEVIDKKIKAGKAGKLAGLAIAVKSNINVKGLTANAGSKTLENYKSTFDATAIAKIKAEDGIIIGMTNCDEFASGSSGETSAYGATKNPINPELIPGGSSSGSAAAVAADFCDLALGSETGGSVRNPASHCGIVGVKPSYGKVSRYGLLDLCMSVDQIGPFSKDVYGAKLLLDVIKGRDEKDATTFDEDIKETKKSFKIGFSKDFEKICSDKKIVEVVKKKAEQVIKKLKWKSSNINLKHIKLAVATYYPLVYVEFFSATRKYDGRKYGKKIEEVAGPEVLRRILGGSEITKAEYGGQYYRTALKVKTLIKKDLDEAFKKVDAIIAPTVPKLPHKIGSKITPEEMYYYDALTIPANLSGVAAMSVPAGEIKGIPIGLQIIVPAFHEDRMFKIAEAFEK